MLLVIGAYATPAEAASLSNGGSSSAHRSWLGARGQHLHHGRNGVVAVDVCSQAVGPGVAHCNARARADLFGDSTRPDRPGAAPTAELGNRGAYDPAYLQSAYNAPSAAGAGRTVAVVDAYDAPNLESDLAYYRSYFGLPACTSANGCFRKIDERGGTDYPAYNAGWAAETTLDVQMVSAICPNCHILVVEATTAQFANLADAVDTAVAYGADVVSNSYGAGEFAGEAGYNSAYDHPGVAIVASSGDSGYGVSYPASAPNVVAAGGTTLLQATNTGTRDATETVWAGAGSGCSTYEVKPAWQTDTGCTTRAVADVAAVADPSTGVWVYNRDDGGWEVFGGTSVSAPIIGAFYALAGDAAPSDDVASYLYAHPGSLNDVTSGSNGSCGTYLCTGASGYDGPTGLGTPDGAAAFSSAGSNPPPNAAAPDFTLALSKPSRDLTPGTQAKRTVTLTPTNGFTGSVRLSVSVSPTTGLVPQLRGAPAAVGPGAFTTPLTLDARRGGTYRVTVTARSGSLVHQRTITVPVNDFTMRVTPAKVSVARGKAARFTVMLHAFGALEGRVRLSTSGLGSHDKAAFARNPVRVGGSVVLTVRTWANDALGSKQLRITGVTGALRHRVTVTLSIK